MSTAPKRSEHNKGAPRAGEASFRYGWRYVKRKGPRGKAEFDEVPLTLEDVLHPQFGDVHVLSDPHTDDCTYLRTVLKERYAADPSVAVLSDCGIFWDQPKLKHHSPDLAVIFGVKERKAWVTFHVAEEGVRPALIIEVTSPDTRVNDVEKKVRQYARAGVPHYTIADDRRKRGRRRVELVSYRLEGKAYQQIPPDEQGRAWLEPIGLWLAVAVNEETGADRLALIDPASGAEIGDYTAVCRALRAAEERAADAEARAAQAAAQAAAEAQARAEAEERLRRLEEELRRLQARKNGDG